jgi:hypothetical protein
MLTCAKAHPEGLTLTALNAAAKAMGVGLAPSGLFRPGSLADVRRSLIARGLMVEHGGKFYAIEHAPKDKAKAKAKPSAEPTLLLETTPS